MRKTKLLTILLLVLVVFTNIIYSNQEEELKQIQKEFEEYKSVEKVETVTASTYDMKGVSRRAISRSIVPESLDEEYFQNIILNFDDKFFDKESLIDYFNEKNISIFYISPYYNTFIVNVNEKQFKQIQNEKGLYFFYNFELETFMDDVKNLVNLTNIYLENENNKIMGFSGEGETIIVIDNTFDTNHTFIKDNIVKSVCFSVEHNGYRNTNSLCNNPEPLGETYQELKEGMEIVIDDSQHPFNIEKFSSLPEGWISSHGTHVAGIAGGRRTILNGEKISGVAPEVKLMLMGLGGYYYIKDSKEILRSMRTDYLLILLDYIIGEGSIPKNSIVSMSFGNGGGNTFDNDYCSYSHEKLKEKDLLVKRQIEDLTKKGMIFVASTGNYRDLGEDIYFPACLEEVISVGAVHKDKNPWVKSGNGKILDVYGYGVDILSSAYSKDNNNYYEEGSGTSAAAPYVSGSIALIKEAFPDWNKERILEEIKKYNDGFATLDDITRPIVSAYNVITNNLEELKNSSSFEEEIDFDVNSTSLELNFSTPINLFLPDNIKQINNTENKTFILNLTNITKGQNKFKLNFSYKMYPSKNFSKTFEIIKKDFEEGDVNLTRNGVVTFEEDSTIFQINFSKAIENYALFKYNKTTTDYKNLR